MPAGVRCAVCRRATRPLTYRSLPVPVPLPRCTHRPMLAVALIVAAAVPLLGLGKRPAPARHGAPGPNN